MKCEHGKEIKVIIVPNNDNHWDSGIDDVYGIEVFSDEYRLKVVGCDKCNAIDAKTIWKGDQ